MGQQKRDVRAPLAFACLCPEYNFKEFYFSVRLWTKNYLQNIPSGCGGKV
jgi:hypothetical protein